MFVTLREVTHHQSPRIPNLVQPSNRDWGQKIGREVTEIKHRRRLFRKCRKNFQEAIYGT